MSNPNSQLFQADDNLFLDLNALNLVRFEHDEDQDVTAHLKFKDGGSETVRGEAARSLRQRLMGIERTTEGASSSVAQAEGRAADFQESPSRPSHITITTTAILGRNKAWFYRKDKSGKALILAFINAKGSCSVRPFDAETSFALGKRYSSGSYQEQFADLIEGAIELTVDSQPNLERDCKQRLPERLFAHLRTQIAEID